MLSPKVLTTAIILSFVVVLYRRAQRNKSGLPLPPGPKKWPLIGSLLSLPTSFEWETYAHWSEVYNSDILHVDAAGTSIIIVNSHQVATELFEKRSAIYSSRIWSTMVHELIGFDWLISFMAYGEQWKERRSLFQHHFHPLDTFSHHPIELEYTHKMLRRLADTPDKFMEHLRHMTGAITISMAYGIKVQPDNDPYIEIAENALIALAVGAQPGAFLVDSFPVLEYVPAWFPGAGFKCKARMWRIWTKKMVEAPFLAAQRQIAEGTATPSFTSMCLNNLDETRDNTHELQVIRDTAASLFVGGADTTVAAMNTFILAMVCYPEVQAKAQEEIDRVLGAGHLPNFADEPSLPYVAAVVKEVLSLLNGKR